MTSASITLRFLLLHLELTDRRGDLGGRQNRRRHLIEQRLEDVMIAPVDQNDVGIASLQRARRGDPGKSAADDHDALRRLGAAASARFRCAAGHLSGAVEYLPTSALIARLLV